MPSGTYAYFLLIKTSYSKMVYFLMFFLTISLKIKFLLILSQVEGLNYRVFN